MNEYYKYRLEHLATLPENWDGENADTISSEAIDETKIVLNELEYLNLDFNFLVPGKNGEVIIDYSKGRRGNMAWRTAEIIIMPDRSRHLLTFSHDKVGELTPFKVEDFIEFINYKEKKSWWKNLFSL